MLDAVLRAKCFQLFSLTSEKDELSMISLVFVYIGKSRSYAVKHVTAFPNPDFMQTHYQLENPRKSLRSQWGILEVQCCSVIL